MAHWQHRPEPGWQKFEFNQPYQRGLTRLRDEVLAKTDFDPATLWQWGTMQAMAVVGALKACEKAFGRQGQEVVAGALREVGLDIGRQLLAGKRKPPELSDAEFMSYYATVINRIVYASLEAPTIDSDEQVSFDILWCPHQDHYQAFDCRVQRYFVQGMLEALEEFGVAQGLDVQGFQVRFDSTIPAGADCCHFTMWKTDEQGQAAWRQYTAFLDEKALRHAGHAAASAAAPRPTAT